MPLGRSGRVRVGLAFATLVPVAILIWLGLRVVRQDTAASRQQQRDVLELAAGRLALELDRTLQRIEGELADRGGILLGPTGPAITAGKALLYSPHGLKVVDPTAALFADAEVAEARGDLAPARDRFRALTGSPDVHIRAGALLRLARVLRKTGDDSAALDAYDALERLRGAEVAGGQPAPIVAAFARARVAAERGETDRLKVAAEHLSTLLLAGGWPIDKPTFDHYCDALAKWGAPRPSSEDIARTTAAIDLWRDWERSSLPARGRRVGRPADIPILVSWVTGAQGVTAWIEPLAAFMASAPSSGLIVSVADTDGTPLSGSMVGGVTLMPTDTRLPYVLRVGSEDVSAGRDDSRRAVMVATLLLAFALMSAAVFTLYRTTTRELALARQQNEFVASVSHEFRTPLTSMRHLTDLLATRAINEERRAHYYALLSRETERLHRLVESLLNFGRIEAGAYAWQLEPVDVGNVVRLTVEEFRQEPEATGREVSLTVDASLPFVSADADALTRAVWNLLENAAKYSTAGSPIRVSVTGDSSGVRVAVGDRGVGISRDDRASIFQRFVRGAAATRSRIGGVGIGLALVSRIAEAHGGRVTVNSEPGQGSLFTLVLPVDGTPKLAPRG